jgi:glyceraldehyde-3-phosphate dehydrogenase/erythrose-4-phosphate dehydrogenase
MSSPGIRLAINGYGCIGSCVLRALYENGARNACQLFRVHLESAYIRNKYRD